MALRNSTTLTADDFAPAFVVVAVLSALSAFSFWRMPDDAGSEISGRKAIDISSRKGEVSAVTKTATKKATEETQDARDQRLG